jgi:tRNA(fMet)-specific endonuclease VapC
MVYILDTDHLSLLESGDSNCARQLDRMGYQRSAITTITVEERVQGWLASVRRASTPSQTDRLIWAYKGLRRTVQYVNGFVILDWTESASETFAELRKAKVRIGTQDLRIASVALSLNATVVTRNRKDFAQVPNLQIEDWSTASLEN